MWLDLSGNTLTHLPETTFFLWEYLDTVGQGKSDQIPVPPLVPVCSAYRFTTKLERVCGQPIPSTKPVVKRLPSPSLNVYQARR
jgi:hypothetical protein